MKRKIIEIDQEKCIGCGLCAGACEQGAIQVIDGKARLVSDSYCDGLGMCLPACPVDAITLREQQAQPFDAARKGFALKKEEKASGCGCSGSAPRTFSPPKGDPFPAAYSAPPADRPESMLRQWPVQLHLISPSAPYFDNARLLIAADCCAYAYGAFHEEFIKGKVAVIGCPKLDDVEPYLEKLVEIFSTHEIVSITVARMSVPCCGGLTRLVKAAMERVSKTIPYAEVVISPDGSLSR